MTRSRQPEAMRMGLEVGVQSRVRHAECEWVRASRSRKRRQQLSATTAKTVWWRGNRYDVLGEDAHTLPVGGRTLESGPRGPRMMPCIRLGRYRGYVVEDHGGSTSPLFCVSDLTTREDAGGWIQVTPEPRALRCPYSVLSFDRIGRWWRECKMLGLGQDVRARVSDPKKRVQTELVVPQHGPGKAMSPQMEIHRGNEHLGSSGEYPGVGEPGGYPRVVGRGNTPRPHYKPDPTPTPTIDPSHNSNPNPAPNPNRDPNPKSTPTPNPNPVSDPSKGVLVVPQHGPGKAMSPPMGAHRGHEHLGSSGEYPGVGEPGGYPRVVGRGNTPRPQYKPNRTELVWSPAITLASAAVAPLQSRGGGDAHAQGGPDWPPAGV